MAAMGRRPTINIDAIERHENMSVKTVIQAGVVGFSLAVVVSPAAHSETLKVLEENTAETEEELREEPYIESELCTSCNDCRNLNSAMFQYNSNKQAYIADPQAGTYKQLVIAAENCPAGCIHPGTPRPDDDTATENIIARAKALH